MTPVLRTERDGALTVLRIAAGLMIWPHGAQKLLGLFGGYGVEGTLGFFTSMGIPPFLGWAAILAEFFGGIALVTGLLTRPAALGVLATLAVAALTVHLPNGFFMNWSGQQKGEGIEFFLLALPVLGVVAWKGAGAWSVDRFLVSLIEKRRVSTGSLAAGSGV